MYATGLFVTCGPHITSGSTCCERSVAYNKYRSQDISSLPLMSLSKKIVKLLSILLKKKIFQIDMTINVIDGKSILIGIVL